MELSIVLLLVWMILMQVKLNDLSDKINKNDIVSGQTDTKQTEIQNIQIEEKPQENIIIENMPAEPEKTEKIICHFLIFSISHVY